MGYRRVTREDRLRIKDGLDAGLTNAEIADKQYLFERSSSYGRSFVSVQRTPSFFAL
jgi:hypothetical protein